MNADLMVLLQIRVVVHALERLWRIRDHSRDTGRSVHSSLSYNRTFCWLRHSMHFFVSHLSNHLQVDVIDAEFSVFQGEMQQKEGVDFSTVQRKHRLFLSNVVQHCMLDHVGVQEGIDAIIHLSLRFLALCRLLLEDDEGGEQPQQQEKGIQSQGSLADREERRKHQAYKKDAAQFASGLHWSAKAGAAAAGVAATPTVLPKAAVSAPPPLTSNSMSASNSSSNGSNNSNSIPLVVPPEEFDGLRLEY